MHIITCSVTSTAFWYCHERRYMDVTRPFCFFVQTSGSKTIIHYVACSTMVHTTAGRLRGNNPVFLSYLLHHSTQIAFFLQMYSWKVATGQYLEALFSLVPLQYPWDGPGYWPDLQCLCWRKTQGIIARVLWLDPSCTSLKAALTHLQLSLLLLSYYLSLSCFEHAR